MNKILAGVLIYLLAIGQAWPQAALLPNAKQTFLDNSGNPLNGGKVYFYVPGSTNKKTTWLNSDQTSNNTNPVILDSAGRAVIYGQGNYRQVVQTSAGATIWDALTTAYGSSSPSGATGTDTAPVGAIMPWAAFSVPTNWLLASGQAVSRADYPDLLTAITISSTTVNCTASSTTLTGFTDTSQIRVGAPIEATCFSTGITVASIVNSTTITISSAAASTSTVTATVFPWGNGNGVDTFNVPDLRGRVMAGADAMGGTAAGRLSAATTITTTSGSPTATVASATGLYLGMVIVSANVPAGTTISALSGTTVTMSGNASASASGTAVTFYAFTSARAPGASGGAGGRAIVQSNLPTVTLTTNITDPGHAHATTNASRYAGTAFATGAAGSDFSVPINASSANLTGINTGSATTGITAATPLGGLNVPLQVIQPTITTNYIIKAKLNTTGAGGVVSWGGLIGDIATDATLQAYVDGGINYAGIADAPTLTMLANVTGGTAQPLPVSLTSWLDATASSSTGAIIYRNGSIWGALAPAASDSVTRILSQLNGVNAWSTVGAGTVQSVGLSAPAQFTVTGSPVTTTGTLAFDFATAPTGTGKFVLDTSPTVSGLTVTGSFTATGLVGNASLANPATTVNGQTCTLGSTCTVTAAATAVTVGTTTVGSGTTTRVLYDNAGVLGEYAISGTGSVAMTNSPVFTTPTLGVASATSINKVAITAPATSATLTIADGKTLTDTSGVGASILLGAAGGGFTGYAGTTCTNQAATALSAAGAATCSSITNAYLTAGTFSSITGTGALAAGSATTGFTINAGNVTWSGQVPGVNVAPVGDASGAPSATFGVIKCDGTTITCASGTATAIGGAATDITVGTTTVSGGSTGNILYNNAGVLGELNVASGSQYLSGTASKILDASVVYQAETTTSFSTTPTFDFGTFYNTKITLTNNISSISCSGQKAGQSGTIRFIQDNPGGNRTLPATFGCNFKFPGGVQPVLTTTAGAIDAIVYSCSATNYCVASLLKNVQ